MAKEMTGKESHGADLARMAGAGRSGGTERPDGGGREEGTRALDVKRGEEKMITDGLPLPDLVDIALRSARP